MAHSVEKIASSPFTLAASRIAAWIMPRLPQWVTPNHITGPGCAVYLAAGSAFYLASFSQAWFVGAVICIFLHRVTDNLDGELARTLAAGRVTRLGGMTAAAPACMVRRNGRRRIEQRRDCLIDAGQEQMVPDREHHTGRSCASPGLRWGPAAVAPA